MKTIKQKREKIVKKARSTILNIHKGKVKRGSVKDLRKDLENINVFKLRFPIKDLQKWSREYSYDSKIEESIILSSYVPIVKRRGYLIKSEFLDVCEWKTQRSKPRCNLNQEAFINEITRIAFATKNEEATIKVLTALEGVQYPTASVILHFFHEKKYPIIDFRALWSLNIDKPPTVYKFHFWKKHVDYCRFLSEESGLDMRTIDRALWAYSKEHQRTKKT